MAIIKRYALDINTQPIQLKRGEAECWILSVIKGAVNVCADKFRCRVVKGEIAVVEPCAWDIEVEPCRYADIFLLKLDELDIANSAHEYIRLINADEFPFNIIAAGKQQTYIDALFQKMETGDRVMPDLIQELLVRVYRASMQLHPCMAYNTDEFINHVCLDLKRGFAKSLNLRKLAARYNMSTSYLSYVFRTSMGIPITQYILERRISAAQCYLSETSMPIKEVAAKSGFRSAGSFSRTFKKAAGMTPGQYRLINGVNSETL